MLFTPREEYVRHEQNIDAMREAEAHRLRQQLTQRRRTFWALTSLFAWLGNHTVRFGYFLGADIQAASFTKEKGEFA